MSPAQRELVAAAVRVYQEIRADIAVAVPLWPLGLPHWTDSWIALGLRAPAATYLTVWHRGPLDGGASDGARVSLSVPHLAGTEVTARVLYPGTAGPTVRWEADRGAVDVTLPRPPAACLVKLTPRFS